LRNRQFFGYIRALSGRGEAPSKRPSSTLLAPAGAFVPPAPNKSGKMAKMTTLWMIVGCGLLAIVYGVWATQSVLSADPGSKKM
jgi:hypothetical protein